MKFQAPKGTRDFYPEQMAIRKWITQRWRDVSERHGFEEYDGPVFESLDLYRVKSGEGIVSELFHFQDRGDREFALRPEMTPTLARMVAAKANALSRPIKWYSVPNLCRAERPQRGRLREFYQWNADILGEDDIVADAECINLAVDFFRDAGLKADDFVIRISSRSLLASLLIASGFDADGLDPIFAALDRRDKVPEDVFETLLDEMHIQGGQRETIHRIGRARGQEGWDDVKELAAGSETGVREFERLVALFDHLHSFGVADFCVFDMSVVRGLAYYTGVVFEGYGKGGLKRAICGGGRYDKLLSDLGGPAMGGVGFATSDVVIEDLLVDRGQLPNQITCPEYFVIDDGEEELSAVLSVVGQLRHSGATAIFSYRRGAIGKQLKQAAQKNCQKAVFVSQAALREGVVQVKDLSTGEQSRMSLDALLKGGETAAGG
jgi:histidyl-tRNA synthetase